MKTKVGCCGKAKNLTDEIQKIKKQLSIALDALNKYKSSPENKDANQAISEILAIGPVETISQT